MGLLAGIGDSLGNSFRHRSGIGAPFMAAVSLKSVRRRPKLLLNLIPSTLTRVHDLNPG